MENALTPNTAAMIEAFAIRVVGMKRNEDGTITATEEQLAQFATVIADSAIESTIVNLAKRI